MKTNFLSVCFILAIFVSGSAQYSNISMSKTLDGIYDIWKVDAIYYADYGGESINMTKYKLALDEGFTTVGRSL